MHRLISLRSLSKLPLPDIPVCVCVCMCVLNGIKIYLSVNDNGFIAVRFLVSHILIMFNLLPGEATNVLVARCKINERNCLWTFRSAARNRAHLEEIKQRVRFFIILTGSSPKENNSSLPCPLDNHSVNCTYVRVN